MVSCRFQMLGGLKITFRDELPTLVITSRKAKLLLVYLILPYDRPPSRKQILFDFWPDSFERQALSNLRKLLHDLRGGVSMLDVGKKS